MCISGRHVFARCMNQHVQPERKAEPNQVVGKRTRREMMGAAPCEHTEEEQAGCHRDDRLHTWRPELHGAMEASNQGPGQPDHEVKTDLWADKPKKERGEGHIQNPVANSRPGSGSEHKRRKQNVIPELIAETPKRAIRTKDR